MLELLLAAKESLGVMSAIVGLVTAVPIFWTWYVVTLGRERRSKEWYRQIRADARVVPVVLVVDLLPGKDMLPPERGAIPPRKPALLCSET